MREDALFVLRLWRDGDEESAWRASLTEVHTRQVEHFASLEALTSHLNERASRKSNDGSLGKGPDMETP